MDHDGMMGRQLFATLAILAFGLIPDRFAGGETGRLRAASAAGCSTGRMPRELSADTTSK